VTWVKIGGLLLRGCIGGDGGRGGRGRVYIYEKSLGFECGAVREIVKELPDSVETVACF